MQIRLGAFEGAEILSIAPRETDATVAVIVALPLALAPAEAVNTAEAAPAGTETVAGTTTCGLVLFTVAVAPPAATGPVMEIVQLLELPAATLAGLQTNEESVDCAATARLNVVVFPLYVAVRTDEPVAFEELDPTTKFVLVAPAAITTGELTLTTKLLLDIATLAPPAGAGPVKDTVHVPLPPAAIVAGEHERPAKVAGAGCTVTVVDFVAPVDVAEMLAI